MLTALLFAGLLQAGTGSGMVRGDVVLNCVVRGDGDLTFCRLVSESPAGRGFGAAALRQFPWIKVPGREVGRQDVPVALRMTAEEARAAGITAPGSLPLVESPPVARPTWKELEASAPPRSRRHRGAALQCVVQADGSLNQCQVLQADEPKYGEAAVRAAQALYRLPTTDTQERATAGRPYNLQISFGRPGPPGPEGTCPRAMPKCAWGINRTR